MKHVHTISDDLSTRAGHPSGLITSPPLSECPMMHLWVPTHLLTVCMKMVVAVRMMRVNSSRTVTSFELQV